MPQEGQGSKLHVKYLNDKEILNARLEKAVQRFSISWKKSSAAHDEGKIR